MLRFGVQIGLWLTAGFAVMATLISRPWGWPEYASDELYVVYKTGDVGASHEFYLVNANGSGQQWKLAVNKGTFTALDCSPDGRIVEFVTDPRHLFVVNRAGIIFERALDQAFTYVRVANDGKITPSGTLIEGINKNENRVYPNDGYEYGTPDISSSGILLWDRLPYGILVTTAAGEFVTSLSQSTNAKWLAPEDVFTFTFPVGFKTGWHQYIEDINTRSAFMLPPPSPSGIFSPDGTKWAISKPAKPSGSTHIFLTSIFSNEVIRQLTYDTGVYQAPLCFLTFRPQMLLADNPQ